MAAADFSLFVFPFSLLIGWLLDLVLGDPSWLPHPVVGFGKMIAFGEKRLNRWSSENHESSLSNGRVVTEVGKANKGSHRKLKGAILAIFLITSVFAVTWLIRAAIFSLPSPFHLPCYPLATPLLLFDAIFVFFCLAGTTLIREVREVFHAVDRSLDEGRKQVARIVGRDTSELSAQEVRTAALETLAENLSDGVIAPLFWLALLGVPGMLAYKMINTLDSMIGYKTERYKDFGCVAAHIDDIANYIPARITALLMVIAAGKPQLIGFVWRNGRNHASPNSGYPEAALAGIVNCRFGGPHYYFGQLFDKPYIGDNNRELTTADMKKAVRINRTAEIMMVVLVVLCCWLIH